MEIESIVHRFLEHNFHDAVLISVSVLSPRTSRHSGRLTVLLEDADTDNTIELKFVSPAAFEFTGDFDVLRDNAGMGNTSHTEAESNQKSIVEIVRRIEQKTNVEYLSMPSPLDKKLARVNKDILFRIFFMGGTLEVVAEKIKITKRRLRV